MEHGRFGCDHRATPALECVVVLALALSACGPGHRLGDADFSGGTLTVDTWTPGSPVVLTSGVDHDSEGTLAEVLLETGSDVARELEARRANERLREASARFDLADRLSERLSTRAQRSLGTRPAPSPAEADFVMELDVHRYGIRANDRSASVFLEADVFLLDSRGVELWRRSVNAWDRLTPHVDGGIGSGAVTAATLSRVTVDELERALGRAADAAANRIDRDLRDDLRDVRRR